MDGQRQNSNAPSQPEHEVSAANLTVFEGDAKRWQALWRWLLAPEEPPKTEETGNRQGT